MNEKLILLKSSINAMIIFQKPQMEKPQLEKPQLEKLQLGDLALLGNQLKPTI